MNASFAPLDPALAEIARLVNAGQALEADDLLARIEGDSTHAAWNRPITISVLRDRINAKRKR